MKYAAEVTFKIGSENESSYEESFDTLQDAVDFIESKASGHMMVTAYINNRRVKVRYGKVIGSDGEPFCTGQVWHDLFADYDYPKITPVDEFMGGHNRD